MMSTSVAIGRDDETLRQRKKTAVSTDIDNNGSVENKTDSLDNTGSKKASKGKKAQFIESFLIPIIITALSAHIRFKGIPDAAHVIWDEAHFGKFGSQYLKHTFYHDVHPVLGKMLVGLSGYIAEYDGSFGFESSSEYPEDLDYVAMRQFNCLFSVFTPTVAYFTAKAMDFNLLTSLLIATMCTYETSYIALSKFILLDSMLLFFTATTFYTLMKFHRENRRPGNEFSVYWYAWLILSGISIGCVCSVKWVGLFVMAVYGIYIIIDLAIKHYDTTIGRIRYYSHWTVRIFTLLVIPFLIYMFCFYIHFSLLYKFGEGVKSTSTLFQLNLEDHDIDLSNRDLYYGSRVSIRSQGLSPNLLHSHGHSYPEGSGQQQITTYGYKDENNDWTILYSRESGKLIDAETYDQLETLETVKQGDVIRLNHALTGANLHSHDLPALISKSSFEVSGYGGVDIGDEKDDWVVEIVEQLHSANGTYASLYETGSEFVQIIHPASTSFRLKHKVLGCYLATTGLAYPKWGFSQGEVVCKNSWSTRDKATWWNIEDNINTNRNASAVEQTYQPPKSKFWRDFVLINFAMAASNNALVPDLDKKDDLASSAWEWPILHVGLRMCGWGNNQVRYFLMSLPATTWTSTLSLFVFVVLTFVKTIQYQRQSLSWTQDQAWYYIIGGIFPFIGWLLHYLPFAVMSRVTYVHHYEPALYFAIFMEGFLFDYMSKSLPQTKKGRFVKYMAYFVMFTLVLTCFWYFSPICLGMKGRKKNYEYLQWFKSWRIV